MHNSGLHPTGLPRGACGAPRCPRVKPTLGRRSTFYFQNVSGSLIRHDVARASTAVGGKSAPHGRRGRCSANGAWSVEVSFATSVKTNAERDYVDSPPRRLDADRRTELTRGRRRQRDMPDDDIFALRAPSFPRFSPDSQMASCLTLGCTRRAISWRLRRPSVPAGEPNVRHATLLQVRARCCPPKIPSHCFPSSARS